MEKTLDVPIFRVSSQIVTDKFDALYKVRTHTHTHTHTHSVPVSLSLIVRYTHIKHTHISQEVKGQGVSVSALLAKAVAMTLERVSECADGWFSQVT